MIILPLPDLADLLDWGDPSWLAALWYAAAAAAAAAATTIATDAAAAAGWLQKLPLLLAGCKSCLCCWLVAKAALLFYP
ncbi:hypothetical protein HIM_07849 [Hirsutella minnesotensis 3608]|uniref:Uncharacterized protein n=1 Tax=Hirsutella minnesotensis 3608 TaxID=1043627 RepID=A0A0F8A412_9HYPO|nr:hypothetical protein HIM_07849 [Hirsutella minnesotensis 3608]